MKKIKEFMYVFFFCVPFAIIIYTGCVIGILIFNLIKFMETKKINDIEVKEEPKQSVKEYEQQGLEKYSHKLEQETLEEAADSYSSNPIFRMGTPRQDIKRGFELGAKWQKEQDKNKYSEEEVLEHLNHLIMMPSSKLDEFTNDEEMVTMKWFEQFKNK
jgi:hypothetical protein